MRKILLACFPLLLNACGSSPSVPMVEQDYAKVDASAHWVGLTTLIWDRAKGAPAVQLRARDSETPLIAACVGDGSVADSPELAARYPHLRSWVVWRCTLDEVTARRMLKYGIDAVALDAKAKVLFRSEVQTPGVIDAIYANDAQLGAQSSGAGTQFAVWAPTARRVSLQLFDRQKRPLEDQPQLMQENASDGVWRLSVPRDLHGTYYRYEVEVFHYATGRVETVAVSDPYALNVSTDGEYSQVIDLDRADTQPEGWQQHTAPPLAKPEDLVIYEAHVRDFSIWDDTVRPEYRGKYLAFTELQSDGMRHLKRLQSAGMTAIQLLPIFDFGTVPENPADRLDLSDRVATLCEREPGSFVCARAFAPTATLGDVMKSFDPRSKEAQSLMSVIRARDGFNWGYDPVHYSAPEGSYATEPEGFARVLELRQAVLSLHGLGLRVVMDVVYNHTLDAGLGRHSVLDKLVPGYYHRRSEVSGHIEQSTCCKNTASEHYMMEKLMVDSLRVWARDYKIDAFRFDLMGHHMRPNMEKALAAVRAVDPDTYFLGEGWDFGEVGGGRRGPNAIQHTMTGAGIGTFNNRVRRAVRGGSGFEQGDDIRRSQGIATGLYHHPNELNFGAEEEKAILLHYADMMRISLAGNLTDFPLVASNGKLMKGVEIDYDGAQTTGYAADPEENVNYISVHDGTTHWDTAMYKVASRHSSQERVRMHNFAMSVPLLGQGVPFIHAGVELLRSKSMQHDSYDSGDWFNRLDYTMESNNWDVGLPREDKDGANYETIKRVLRDPQARPSKADIALANEVLLEWLNIRHSSPLFRLPDAEHILDMVSFHNTGKAQVPGLVVMQVRDTRDIDYRYSSVLVVFNPTANTQQVSAQGLAYELHPVQLQSADERVRLARRVEGKLVVPPLTTAVFVTRDQ